MNFITLEKDEVFHPWIMEKPAHLKSRYLGVFAYMKFLVIVKYHGKFDRELILEELRTVQSCKLGREIINSPLSESLSHVRTRTHGHVGVHDHGHARGHADGVLEDKEIKRKKKKRNIVDDNIKDSPSSPVPSFLKKFEVEPWFGLVYRLVILNPDELLDKEMEPDIHVLICKYWKHTISFFMEHIKQRMRGEKMTDFEQVTDYFLNCLGNETVLNKLRTHLYQVVNHVNELQEMNAVLVKRLDIEPGTPPDEVNPKHPLAESYRKLYTMLHEL